MDTIIYMFFGIPRVFIDVGAFAIVAFSVVYIFGGLVD